MGSRIFYLPTFPPLIFLVLFLIEAYWLYLEKLGGGMTVTAALVNFAVGLGFFILAYLVAHKKWSFLIAGYNTMTKSKKEKFDEDTFCKDVGKLLFSGGGLVCLAGLGILLDLSWLVGGAWIVFIAINIGFVIYANIGDRYKK